MDELGTVVSGRYYDLNGLVRPFPFVELAQLFAQPKDFHSNNGVRGLIKRLGPPEDFCRERVFLETLCLAVKIPLTNVLQQAGQPRPRLKDLGFECSPQRCALLG
jgi:hypothetical protein